VLAPQHFNESSSKIAQVVFPPGSFDITTFLAILPAPKLTVVGMNLLAVVPSPNSP
jgi:hypothetical protein